MADDTTAQCAAHSAPAVGVCERCGTFVCDACGHREDGHLRCVTCPAPAAERPPPITFAALLISALGLMCPPLSLVGIALALIWRGSRGPRTRLGVQYARWALIVGVMTLLAGSGMIGLGAYLGVQMGRQLKVPATGPASP